MAKLPKSVINLPVTYKGIPVHEFMEKEGYGLVSRGKVRDTYDLGDGHYAVVASDRISIFDFVLPAIVPGKGETLTALTNFWLTEVLSPFRHHLIDGYPPLFNGDTPVCNQLDHRIPCNPAENRSMQGWCDDLIVNPEENIAGPDLFNVSVFAGIEP